MFVKKFKFFTLALLTVLAVLGGVKLSQTVLASEVMNYQLDASLSHTRTGEQISGDSTITSGESISATYKISFPDSQKIEENDTLILDLPKELRFITSLDFDVKNSSGSIVGKAHTDATTGKVTITFTDYYTRLPENKELLLQFNLTINREVVTESGPVTVTIGSKIIKFNYKKDDGSAGDYEMKYGYQDSQDPSIIKWRIILNARQDILRGMTIVDNFGDGQTLIPESFRAVRYATQPTPIQNEAHILTLTPIDNFSSKAVFTRNENGGITGFTIPFGDNYNWAMYIEYSTRLPEGSALTGTVSNNLSWSATNFGPARSLTREVRLESGSGEASGEKSENIVLKAKKELIGADLKEGQFQFELYSADDLEKPLQTVSNAADGSITFDTIRYSSVGTYNYIIKEKVVAADKLHQYDTHEIKVTVTVTDEDGRKMGQVSYGDSNTTFTNNYIGSTTVKGQKTWSDNDNQDGLRPDKLTVILSKTVGDVTSEVARKEVTAATNWSYEFTNLPEVENGQKIVYSVSEEDVTGYTSSVSGYNLTNTHTPELVSVPVQKLWDDADNQDGIRPDTVTVNLLANGVKVASQTITAENDWKTSFDNLPKYANGQELVYTIVEEPVADYTSSIDQTTGTIINRHAPGKTSLSVSKAWNDGNNQDGLRPSSVQVQLYANGEAVGESVTLSAENSWTHVWSDLAEKAKGQAIVYSVKEVSEVAGYQTTVTEFVNGHATVTNTHTPAITSVAGQKTWDDENDKDKLRPTKITVILSKAVAGQAPVEILRKEVTAADDWKYEFTNLPKFENGQELIYSISEAPVFAYETEVRGFNLVNRHVPVVTPPTPPAPNEPGKPGEPTPPTPDQPKNPTPKPDQPKSEKPKTDGKSILPKTGTETVIWMSIAGVVFLAGLGLTRFYKKD